MARAAGTAAAAAAGARLAWTALPSAVPGGPGRWQRSNHRGVPLTLLEGPAWCLGALTGVLAAGGLPSRVRAAAALAVVGAGGLGVLDDLAGTSADKGLRGHLGALARGRLTTGAAKIIGIGATGLVVAATVLPPRAGALRRVADVAVAGGVVAGAANLLNLLDLRAGRALKVAALAAPALAAAPPAGPLVAATVGASAAMLPLDLRERGMLGDGGANAAGALLGTALVAGTAAAGRLGPAVRAATLGGLLALTLASERISFTAVIERSRVLRSLDDLGRR